MAIVDALLARKLDSLTLPLALRLPGGERVGQPDAAVTLHLHDLGTLAHLAAGEIGRVAGDYVEGRLDITGSMRDLMLIAAEMLGDDPTRAAGAAPWNWWREIRTLALSKARHKPHLDAEQVQFHYDVSDAFYALWLDPQRVYSCAYYREAGMHLAQAQEAKLDHICRKLMLREGERFLDIGAGWGALLLWAAEHYGVRGHGVTLSRNQHAHVSGLIEQRGLTGRVSIELADYRALADAEPFERIASVGMFEHVGRAQLPAYFTKVHRLLKPGGLLMNHGITAGGTGNHQLGAGMGDFIERYIFPGGELMHVSKVLQVMSEAGIEPLDVENLRPHYGRTLWAWSDALEARLGEARELTNERVVRAYRLYLACSAMGFERGWMGLYQMLGAHPDGERGGGHAGSAGGHALAHALAHLPGAQSAYPFRRDYMYAQTPLTDEGASP